MATCGTDDEREVRRLRGRDVQVARPAAAEHGGEQHAVAEAGDREELGDALEETDDRGLEPAQVVHAAAFRDRDTDRPSVEAPDLSGT